MARRSGPARWPLVVLAVVFVGLGVSALLVVDDEHPARPLITGSLYVNVDDVDALAAELAGKVELSHGPADQPHGMREIGLSDPNGYYLIFGQPIG